jgi:hypothetical protein
MRIDILTFLPGEFVWLGSAGKSKTHPVVSGWVIRNGRSDRQFSQTHTRILPERQQQQMRVGDDFIISGRSQAVFLEAFDL